MFNMKKIFVLTVVALAMMALAACGGGAGTAKITLVENPWPASELNVAVAKIIIEKELGNEVEIIALDENAQWDALAAGDVDAVLEVWPSGHGERIAEYIGELKTVEDGGKLGPLGEIGWYVPTYAVEANPALATWEGYVDPAVGEMFASAETGSNGRFIGADPSWVQNDEAIIANLGLPFQVVWAGSEEALLAEVSSSVSREEPVLFYFYAPHAIFSKFDLTQVELPAYSDDCYADAAAIDCAYPADELMKILSGGLAEKDANVRTFLKNFNYSSDAQVAMLAGLDGGQSVEEAAQAWVDGNESTWKAWLP
ncbi:MAG: glycine betaine/proline transport system substrate-binding protein [Candidatus Promineifilaceae bacterium]|jgi:glycine betaine/proline transport system substrate-binding protein